MTLFESICYLNQSDTRNFKNKNNTTDWFMRSAVKIDWLIKKKFRRACDGVDVAVGSNPYCTFGGLRADKGGRLTVSRPPWCLKKLPLWVGDPLTENQER